MQKNYLVDSVETLEKKIAEVKEAQAKFATYTQEQVDAIFRAAALAANKERIPLAEMAVEETGMGVVEDKVIKNHYAAEYIYNAYKDSKTCGVIEEDPAFGIKRRKFHRIRMKFGHLLGRKHDVALSIKPDELA